VDILNDDEKRLRGSQAREELGQGLEQAAAFLFGFERRWWSETRKEGGQFGEQLEQLTALKHLIKQWQRLHRLCAELVRG
jgi:hypothetical protein